MKTIKKVKFIPCDEFSQIYNWQRTMRRISFMSSISIPESKLNYKEKTPRAIKKRKKFVKEWIKKNMIILKGKS